jgi:hypothetical protein
VAVDEKGQFLKLISDVKRNLMKYHFFHFFQYALFFIASSVFAITMLARWVMVSRIHFWLVIVSVVAFAGVFYYWYQKRPTTKTATLIYDDEVKDNRVVTAFSFLTDSSYLAKLQRFETIALMKKTKQQIFLKQKYLFHWKELSIAALLFCGVVLSFLYPSEPMVAAESLQTNKELIEELKEELAELEEKMNEQEVEELKEKLEQLQEQLKEVATAEDALQELLLTEALLEEMKLELELKEQQLQLLSEKFNDADMNELANALKELSEAALQETLEALKGLELTDEQKQALLDAIADLTGNELGSVEELTAEDLAKLLEQLEDYLAELMEASLDLESLTQLQQQLQQSAMSMNASMSNAGLQANPSLSFSRPQTQPSSPSNGNPSDQQGSETANESGEGSNQGSGENGSGSGQGQGQGQGSGNGTGNGGQGPGAGGQGAGTGQGSRELVTVPDRLQSETTLEIDQGELGSGSGEKQQSDSAPVLRGSTRPFQEVIGHYEASYRDSMNRMQLPRHLEGVVRDYFSQLNTEQE